MKLGRSLLSLLITAMSATMTVQTFRATEAANEPKRSIIYPVKAELLQRHYYPATAPAAAPASQRRVHPL